LVEKRNFTELASEFTRDHFGKCHEAGLRVRLHGEAARKDPASSAVQTLAPKTKVSPRLKATVGLM
jgi:hypothetical protein